MRGVWPCAAGTLSRPNLRDTDSGEITRWQTSGLSLSLQAEHVPEWRRVTLISDDSPPPPPALACVLPLLVCIFFFFCDVILSLSSLSLLFPEAVSGMNASLFLSLHRFPKVRSWM